MLTKSWRSRPALVASLAVVTVPVAYGACTTQEADPPSVQSNPKNSYGGSSGKDAAGSTVPSGDASAPSGSGLTVLTSGVHSPQAIALGPDTVYWTTALGAGGVATVGDASAGTGSVESVPRAGGAVTDVVTGLSNPEEIALSSTTLFFAQGAPGSGTLDAYSAGAVVVEPVATGQTPPLPMLAYDGALYWANGAAGALTLDAFPLTGGAVSRVATLTADASSYAPLALATDGSTFYILASKGGDGYILEARGGGNGSVSELWHGAGLVPVDLVLSGDTLFWTVPDANSAQFKGGEILKLPTSGGSPSTLITALETPGLINPARLAADSSNVYVTDFEASGYVLAVSFSGAVTTLASGQDYPEAIATDSVDNAVYFGTATTVAKVAR